ncbi:adenylosuccinate synthase [Anaplasma marginale]|uniref:Adenylosuccinate synthetase n=6 Tax=Anaplasma marginale TaxID=770 RepID=PURA_ANAMM|nr:adenylosuccinate synthase [Anaplasma marginale]Q5PAA8.2 RecName: Full=Adenylosuccinate synthetase; Short=AMPSase; Short=AdSS; AltName: Full=IMP--aspartate ligase [Anaplasma marginale str. St. Maries]
MASIVVVGLQWGDEGKGKIVDWLSVSADAVVRFQGGNNAGHTVVADGRVYKLSLLPTSVLRQNKLSMIGSGVALDPYALVREVDSLKDSGIFLDPDSLCLSESCPLVLSVHRDADSIMEEMRGNESIGTTCMGIGPCYEDKVGRRAIRLCDLLDETSLYDKVLCLLSYHNLLRRATNRREVTPHEIMDELTQIAPKVLPFMKPVPEIIVSLIKQGKTVLFEGAQGALLDIDHGTYPYVTSSNTVAGYVRVGCGVGALGDMRVLGLAKAYTTRVGNGPFATEQTGTVGDAMFERGREVGTVTNRVRRCGWFDAVSVRQAALSSGASEMVITKLDVLDTIDEIKVCTKYRCGEESYDYLPAASHIQNRLEPVYETLPGWRTSTLGAVSRSDLPENAVSYISRLEELVGVPVSLVSTGPERNHIVPMNP